MPRTPEDDVDMSADIDPRPLRASLFDGYVGWKPSLSYAAREVYDYEMELYTRSDGGIEIDGRYTPFAPGDINVRKPGQIVRGVPPYRCYIICFDAQGDDARREGYVFGTGAQAQRRTHPMLDALPDKLTCPSGPDMERLFERVCLMEGAPGELSRLKARAALMEILSQLCELASPESRCISPEVRRAAREIAGHFTENMSVNALTDESGLSRATFHRRFLRETGRTPLGMMTELRIGRARELLLMTDYSIADVGALCGYADDSYFARVFRRACGMSPAEFRAGRRR